MFGSKISEIIKTKTFWVGLLLIAFSVERALGGDLITGIVVFLNGSGLISLRASIADMLVIEEE